MIKGYETKDIKTSKTKAKPVEEGVIFKDGEPLDQKAGFLSKEMLMDWINENKN